MGIKIFIARFNKKRRKCLRCKRQIETPLKDDTVYTCEGCGQQHFVDILPDYIALTVVERPDVRRRPLGRLTPEQRAARKRLFERVEAKRHR